MDSNTAQELFKRFAGAIAYVAVEGQDGVQGIGSAFHVGEGVFVTARHVVENLKILEVNNRITTVVGWGSFPKPTENTKYN